jgi:uncharacterized protein (DUF4415 family)
MSLFDRFRKKKDSEGRPRLIDLLDKPPSPPPPTVPYPNPDFYKEVLANRTPAKPPAPQPTKSERNAAKQQKEKAKQQIKLIQLKHDLLQAIKDDGSGYRHTLNFLTLPEEQQYIDLFVKPLPTPLFPHDVRTFKVIPTEEDSLAASTQLFNVLHGRLHGPLCLELISEAGSIYFQITVGTNDAALIEQQFDIYLPGFALEADHAPAIPTALFVRTARPKFSYHALGKIKGVDPYTELLRGLSDSPEDEFTCIQFVCQPLSSFTLSRIPLRDTDKKNSLQKSPAAWIVCIKFWSTNKANLASLPKFLRQYETMQQSFDIGEAQPSRGLDRHFKVGSIVSTDELVSLAHFPDATVECDRLERISMKAKLPAENYTTGPVVIGESEARGTRKPVTLPASARDRHLYIVGKSGMGKSTLLTNAVIANMKGGDGVCVIDPHGDLVATGDNPLLDYVPEDRIKDTIYFNAADKEYPLALNMLSARRDDELSLLADNLLVVFRRQSEGWGPRMEDILRATLQTLMHIPGTTFLDIKRLLHNDAFRQSMVRKLDHPMLKEFWEEDFATNYNRKDATAPIISRVNKFLYLPQLYAMLSSPESKLDFYDIIQSNKILLVNLSSGTIGEDNAQLLGSLIVTQLQMAAMRRAGIPPAQRKPYYLYVDEFQNFTTASFEKILSEARKYKLCLTLAHQFISQLPDTQRDAIFGNVGSMVMFSCGDKDANALRYQLGSYEPKDLVNLKKFEALLRPESAQETFPFKTIPPPPKPEGFAQTIIEYTRMTYATIIDPDAAPQIEEQSEEKATPQSRITAKPIAALEKNFACKGDELLYYIEQAEYLNTDQIKQLCYSHQAESARGPAASRDLKKLIDAKRLKSDLFGKGNIYFAGRTPKPTSHNVEVRNLLVKIIRSEFEIAEVTFCPQLPSLVPDLVVSFLAADGSQIKTFWEYDAGTEGIAELMKKVARYAFYKDEAITTFVFNSRSRLEQVNRSIRENFIRLAVLEEIGTLKDPVFQYANGERATPLF